MRLSRRGLSLFVALLLPCGLTACLWDYDTLKMERQRFPGTLELITGKFLRHSDAFYQWRIRDRLKRLKTEPSILTHYDDLAVAYEKTGEYDKAIETILKKDKLQPGLYETEANLGTFHVHAGQLEKGLEHVNKAIAINPDAHFGREKYQKYLIEWVLSRRDKDGSLALPVSLVKVTFEQDVGDEKTETVRRAESFASYLMRRKVLKGDAESREQALKGLLGMMRFGRHDSPILLEATASLLADRIGGDDAKRMGARAYLKASYGVTDEQAKAAYRKLAEEALSMQTRGPGTERTLSLVEVERRFGLELAEAKTWYAKLEANEERWIREGKNPEAEFDKLYDREPTLTFEEVKSNLSLARLVRSIVSICLIGMNGLLIALNGILILRRRRPLPRNA